MSAIVSPAFPKLHLGCGRTRKEGWVNLDWIASETVDVVANLDDCANTPLPFAADSFDEFLGSHLLEHIAHPLPLMQELHRIAKSGAKAEFHMPYGSSDDAFEDPTHVKQYFLQSFGYFSQPFYWRADYGYRGDWHPERIVLQVEESRYAGATIEQVMHDVQYLRNVVHEMHVELIAVKPIREPLLALQTQANVQIQLVS